MNIQQAKETLLLFRPGTEDGSDPDVSEALELVKTSPELKKWFDEHCALQSALRAKFRQLPVPEGLREQILSERPLEPQRTSKRPMLIAGFAGVALLLIVSIVALVLTTGRPGLPEYQSAMVRTALDIYAMDLESNDLSQIRAFLATRQTVSDYTLPAGLEAKAAPVGCVALEWHGRPVSMICFSSGDPQRPGRQADLYLFVTDNGSFRDEIPVAAAVARNQNATTATWTAGGRTYFLVGEGSEEFLSKYL